MHSDSWNPGGDVSRGALVAIGFLVAPMAAFFYWLAVGQTSTLGAMSFGATFVAATMVSILALLQGFRRT